MKKSNGVFSISRLRQCRAFGQRSLRMERLEDRRMLYSVADSDPGFYSPTQTTGLFGHDEANSFEGYTLFAPSTATDIYLLDNEGTVINTWESDYFPGLMGYLLPNGDLLRAGVRPQDRGGVNGFQANGLGGQLEILDWDGNQLWNFSYSANQQHISHHDIEPIFHEDGSLKSILMIAFDYKTRAQGTAAGRDYNDPSLLNDGIGHLYPDSIIEVVPNTNAAGNYVNGGTIVWEWHAWDHLVQDRFSGKNNYVAPAAGGVGSRPERININFTIENLPGSTGVGRSTPADMMHANGISYNPEQDLIVLSLREYNEIWVIDHSTTTAEAATSSGGKFGKGGDLLFRWGNPEAYGGDAADRTLFWQHDPVWVLGDDPNSTSDDMISVFNNGTGRPNGAGGLENYSSVELIQVPAADLSGAVQEFEQFDDGFYGPNSTTDIVWSYQAPDEFYAPIISGAQHLPNGNFLVSFGVDGNLVEVQPNRDGGGNLVDGGTIVWRYVNPQTGGGTLGKNSPLRRAFPDTLPQLKTNFVFKSRRYGEEYFQFDDVFTQDDLSPSFRDTVGLVDPLFTQGWDWWMNNEIGGSTADLINFQTPRAAARMRVIAGDWNNDGYDTVGLYDPVTETWYLNNLPRDANGDIDPSGNILEDMYVIQTPTAPDFWQPIVGDWDGDGDDTPGLYDPFTQKWYLNNLPQDENGDYDPEGYILQNLVMFQTPAAPDSWRAIAGDWDGDGIDTVGLFDPLSDTWYLNNLPKDAEGNIDLSLDIVQDLTIFSTPAAPDSWLEITGDWNDDGLDTIGLYDQFTNTWYLNNRSAADEPNDVIVFKTPTVPSNWRPFAGNFNHQGIFADGAAGNNLTLAADAVEKTSATAVASVSQEQADSILQHALACTLAADGASADALNGVQVVVSDLPGGTLARTLSHSSTPLILIDDDAAGQGWFVDATPADSREFVASAGSHDVLTAAGSEAVAGIDLLTVINHELGHVRGYEHRDVGIMQGSLSPGVRRMWQPHEVDDSIFEELDPLVDSVDEDLLDLLSGAGKKSCRGLR